MGHPFSMRPSWGGGNTSSTSQIFGQEATNQQMEQPPESKEDCVLKVSEGGGLDSGYWGWRMMLPKWHDTHTAMYLCVCGGRGVCA